MIFTQTILAVLSGIAVGFSLGLIGGGGSILAVPLLLYVVGVTDPHIAIGTSAFAVSVNAFANFVNHWRAGTVKWSCALIFASGGVVGAATGSTLGKLFDGQKLLFLFALVMFAAGIAVLRRRDAAGDPHVHMTPRVVMNLVLLGLGAGFVSGFFGIGGGFLIVPGIMLGAGIPITNAIGSSLFSVGAFGLTTAINYALSGLVDWRVALEFIAGGVVGGFFGIKACVRLGTKKRVLNYVFATLVFATATYMLVRTGLALTSA